jgi:S1-C subfamily serine protease
MVCPIRTPLLCSLAALLAAGAPLRAQVAGGGATRRPSRAASADGNEQQLRRLERAADSLTQLYNEGEDLSAVERHAVGMELDRTVAQIEELARRIQRAPGMSVRVRVAPMIDERTATEMSNALRQAQASRLPLPRGWLGIVVSGTAREPRVDNGELIIRYLTHPVIVSVDPSSPAEEAGLAPDDTLLAYDGRDVRDRDISLTKLLRPNSRVLVRIRRDGRTKDVPVTIRDVPSRIRLRAEANFELRAPRVAGLPETMVFPRGPVPATAMAPRPAPPPSMGVAMPMPPLPALAPTPAMIISSGMNSVLGAQLAALSGGLARTVGVPRGVLVTYAAVGSQAYASGLRDGDVIVSVAGEPVRTVAEVREQVQAAWENGESAVDLECVRDKKPVRFKLRWNGSR